MFPKEHGAWAILAAPILVGLLAAPSCSPAAAGLFCLGALAAFLTRAPLQVLLIRPYDGQALSWMALYSALTLVSFLPLIFSWERWQLLFFTVPVSFLLAENLFANRTGRRFSALNEAAGVLGLCLGAPAAFYAACGDLGSKAWALWLLCAAYFIGPIFHVKMAALQHRAVADSSALPKLRHMRRLSAAYHGLILAIIAGWAAQGGLITGAAVIPFAAAFLKTVARGFHGPERVDFRALGYAEVAYSILFVVVMGAANIKT